MTTLRISERRAARAKPVVTRLRVIPKPGPQAELIGEAKKLLDLTQRGEVIAFAGAVIYSDGANAVMRAGLQDRAVMVYALERAKLRLMDFVEGNQ